MCIAVLGIFISVHSSVIITSSQQHLINRKMEGSNYLETSMKQVLEKLSPLSSSCCIYRVPKRLRRVSEKAYTPQVVSIGPLHHGKEGLKPMEEIKNRYLQDFLSWTKVSLGDYIKKIRDQEAAVRGCYAETIELSSDDFVRIILVDAAFIIEVLMRYYFQDLQVENDFIFKKPRMLDDVWPDMRMLENQLPFFILNDLFDLHKITLIPSTHNRTEGISIINLSHYFFKNLMHIEEMEDTLDGICPSQVDHFVDFVRKLYPLPPLESQKCRKQLKTLRLPSMTELSRAGVKFKVGSSKNIFDIKFTNGTLEIPKVTISDESEVTIANLLVFEQNQGREIETYINDYVAILNLLVNTPEDIALLVKNKIVDNRLSDNIKGCTLIKNLEAGVNGESYKFYFANVCADLKKYYKVSLHRCKEYLRKHFFSSPWATKEIIAAIVFIVLTLIQTVCSIISLKHQ